MPPSAGAAQFGAVRYTQAQMEQFIAAHERHLRGELRSKRAVMRFLQAQGLDLSGRQLVECDFTSANLTGAKLGVILPRFGGHPC